MKKIIRFTAILAVCFGLSFTSYAQTPWDEVMMGRGEICAALIYEHSSWDQYWEGTYLRENANIGTFTRQTAMPMIAMGLTKKINLISTQKLLAVHRPVNQVFKTLVFL